MPNGTTACVMGVAGVAIELSEMAGRQRLEVVAQLSVSLMFLGLAACLLWFTLRRGLVRLHVVVVLLILWFATVLAVGAASNEIFYDGKKAKSCGLAAGMLVLVGAVVAAVARRAQLRRRGAKVIAADARERRASEERGAY